MLFWLHLTTRPAKASGDRFDTSISGNHRITETYGVVCVYFTLQTLTLGVQGKTGDIASARLKWTGCHFWKFGRDISSCEVNIFLRNYTIMKAA